MLHNNINTLEWAHAYAGRMHAAPRAHMQGDDSNALLEAKRIGAHFCTEADADRMPFVTMPYLQDLEKDIFRLLPRLRSYEHMLVLGIGGSALGARALQKAFAPSQDGPNHTGPWLWVADNVCPDSFETLLHKLPAEKTIVLCISKSGGTIETIAQYFLVSSWLKEKLNAAWTQHVVVITDKNKGYLRSEAQNHELFSLEVPDHLGGRYSALSAVGMLPCAFMGIDWQNLLAGASSVAKPLLEAAKNPQKLIMHPAYSLASWCKNLEDYDYSQLIFFSYIPAWSHMGDWFAQLWAESLGKEGKGTMPIPAVGVTDQHSVQQMFLDGPRNKACLFISESRAPKGPTFPQDLPNEWQWLCGKPFGALLEAEALGTRMALRQCEVPLVHLEMSCNNAYTAGALMLLLEACTVFTGLLMRINPLDQPAVELGKRLANARLGAPGYIEEEAALDAYQSVEKQRQEF